MPLGQLANNEQYVSHYHLLELFAYHTYGDYKGASLATLGVIGLMSSIAKKDSLPALNASQLTKLKHLSIVSLAMQTRVRPPPPSGFSWLRCRRSPRSFLTPNYSPTSTSPPSASSKTPSSTPYTRT